MSTTPAVPSVRKDRIRFVALMAKKDGMSDEEFYKYWHEVHGPLFTSMEIVQRNLLKYEQHHYNPLFDESAQALGVSLPPYRGLAIFEAESYEKVLEIFSSEEYRSRAFPDQFNFMNNPKTGFFPGAIYTYIDRN